MAGHVILAQGISKVIGAVSRKDGYHMEIVSYGMYLF